MTEKDIKQLATRFMEGETSLDEERRLAEYFREHPNEPGMEDMASMFVLFDTGMPIEGVTDAVPKAQPHRRIALLPVRWKSVAAVAAVLVAFTFSIRYLHTFHEQKTTPVVCQVTRQTTEKQPTAQPAPMAEPVAEHIAEPATKPVFQVAHKPFVAKVKPKSQSKPVPELLPDSVVKATLMRQEREAQMEYKQQMLAQAQAERELRQQAMMMEAVAEYVANMEYVETIQVW